MATTLDTNFQASLQIYPNGQVTVPVIHLKVKSIQASPGDSARVDERKILSNFGTIFANKPLKLGDIKSIPVGNTLIKLKVKKFTYTNYEPLDNLPEKGKEWTINRQTVTLLNKGKYSSQIDINPQRKPFIVTCELKIDASNLSDIREPFFINYESLIQKISIFFSANPITPGISMECLSGDDKLSVIIHKITDLYSGHIHLEPKENEPVTTMGPHVHIAFEPTSPLIALGKNKVYEAASLIIQIVAVRSHDVLETRQHAQWFFADDILDSLIELSKGVVWKGRPWIINVPNRKGAMNTLEVEILGGCDSKGSLEDADPENLLAKLWQIKHSTQLTVNSYATLPHLRIGNSRVAEPAKRIFVEYEILSKPITGALPIIHENIISALKSKFDTVMNGDHYCYKDPSHCLLEISIEDMVTTSETKSLFLPLGKITEETEFYITPASSSQSPPVQRANIEANQTSAKDFLLFSGIGGTDDSFTDYLDLLKAQFVTEPKRYLALHQKPPKGMILYGPEGSRKTETIHKICKWLQVQRQNFYTLNSSEFTQTWNGQIELEFCARFDKAFEDYKMKGEDSPLHVIYIDNIDTLISPEINEEALHKNQFHKIFNGRNGIWPRLLIIGTASLPNSIEKKLISPLHFEKEFKLGPPSLKGRNDVFAIHTKRLREKGSIDALITNEHLASLTQDYTCAEIEYAVKSAFSIADKRFREDRFRRLNITQDDFNEAINSINRLKKKDQEKVGSYIS